ncbi:50S ribosomal protein L11 methyltransferase [bacterium]|nr:50S ribosomal protein L11 methyltransferase [bacterium]
MTNYYELYIKINPNIEDDVANICFENLDCEGVLLEEQKFKDLEMTETSRGTLKVFLRSLTTPDESDVCEFIKSKKQALIEEGFSEEDLGSWDCALLEKENEDWSKKWKENWEVTHISDKVVVVPSWLEYEPKAEEITISLDPGCAFGTGTHQTTQLCVVGMEQYLEHVKGKNIADIGMGSGILSIIAKKFGANHVYGCDNDPTVIDVAIENAKKNNAECVFELGTVDKVNEKFDFVCANILHNVLYEIMPDLKRILKDDGVISLSGIMDNKKDIVLEAIDKNNLKILKTNVMEPWVSYVVSK